MYCHTCNLSEDEAELHQGIFEGQLILVCKLCAEIEEIPLIKRPTQDQLTEIDKKHSVRERMGKISGFDAEKENQESVQKEFKDC